MNIHASTKDNPTWAWIVGILVPVLFAMGSYIFTSSATKAEATTKYIEDLKERENQHDIALAVIKQSLLSIQKEQSEDSRTIEAIAKKLNVITFAGPDR